MGGWNIWYALINFAILAVGLYLVGKKLVLNKYKSRRDGIARELEQAEEAGAEAARLDGDLAQAEAAAEAERAALLAQAEAKAREESAALNERALESTLAKHDRARASYYNYYTENRWGDAKNYDLCLNAALGRETCADLIVRAAKAMEAVS